MVWLIVYLSIGILMGILTRLFTPAESFIEFVIVVFFWPLMIGMLVMAKMFDTLDRIIS